MTTLSPFSADDFFVSARDRVPRRYVVRWKIAEHWGREPSRCWRCDSECRVLERAHLIDRCFGGLDHAGNLALLCGYCHRHMPSYLPGQESEAISYAMPDRPGISKVIGHLCHPVPDHEVDRIWREHPQHEAVEIISSRRSALLAAAA